VINLAKIYNEVGDLETSKMILDDGIDVHPEEINLRLMKGEVLLREGNYAEAREEVQKVIQSKPEMAAGYQFLGNVYMYENNWEKAKESFKKAKELPDEWSHPLKDAMLESLIAFADNKEGNKEEAELKWQQILEKIESEKVDDREMKLESCLYRSGIYAAMGKEQEAILCLEEATKKNWMDYKISSHPAFDNIKSNPDFEKLMKSIKSKADSLKMELESIHSQTSL
jgi:tetratricopeptide (TPR) repeat protein